MLESESLHHSPDARLLVCVAQSVSKNWSNLGGAWLGYSCEYRFHLSFAHDLSLVNQCESEYAAVERPRLGPSVRAYKREGAPII